MSALITIYKTLLHLVIKKRKCITGKITVRKVMILVRNFLYIVLKFGIRFCDFPSWHSISNSIAKTNYFYPEQHKNFVINQYQFQTELFSYANLENVFL